MNVQAWAPYTRIQNKPSVYRCEETRNNIESNTATFAILNASQHLSNTITSILHLPTFESLYCNHRSMSCQGWREVSVSVCRNVNTMVFFDTFVHDPGLPYGGFTVYIKLFNLGILLASLLCTVFHSRFHQYYTLSPVQNVMEYVSPLKPCWVCQSWMVLEAFVTTSSFVSW